jgi:hypothetical protein
MSFIIRDWDKLILNILEKSEDAVTLIIKQKCRVDYYISATEGKVAQRHYRFCHYRQTNCSKAVRKDA